MLSQDVVAESGVTVKKEMALGFGKCKLCVQVRNNILAHNLTHILNLTYNILTPKLLVVLFRPPSAVESLT